MLLIVSLNVNKVLPMYTKVTNAYSLGERINFVGKLCMYFINYFLWNCHTYPIYKETMLVFFFEMFTFSDPETTVWAGEAAGTCEQPAEHGRGGRR